MLQKSAFVVRNRLYIWKCMHFGLYNDPATFKRLKEKVTLGLQWKILLTYVEDLNVLGNTV